MLKKTAEQKKIIAAFLMAVFCGMMATVLPLTKYFGIRSLSSLIYAGTVLGWAFLIRARIIEARVRRYLLLAAAFMIIIFVIRECRWYFFEGMEKLDEFARYGYHFCFTMVPFCALLAALCVGKEPACGMPEGVMLLWLTEAVMTVLIFMNPVHGLLFRNLDIRTGTYEYGPVYYMCVVWESVLGFTAFGVILNRCRVSASRKKWYIPFLGMAFGTVLLIVYFICGGAPSIAGLKIFNLQEVFCLTFILPFEALIQTGILPGNSRYALFFRESSIGAAIEDREGRIVFVSRRKSADPGGENENARLCEHEIRGGKITWIEDLTTIRTTEEQLRKVTELLEDENELITQENEIRAERISYETQNRLYDKIAGMVREQTAAIREALKDKPGEPVFSERLPYIAVLGAYVKRMGNLMLLSDQKGTISSGELVAAIRESFDSLKLMDKAGVLRVKGEEELPRQLAVLAYELFETMIERTLPETAGVAVQMRVAQESGFRMEIRTDAAVRPLTEQWKEPERKEIGATLESAYEEDEGWRYIFVCPLVYRTDREGAIS